MTIADQSYGYLDPGSGAIIWQVLAACVIGVAMYAKKIWGFIQTKFEKVPVSSEKTKKTSISEDRRAG